MARSGRAFPIRPWFAKRSVAQVSIPVIVQAGVAAATAAAHFIDQNVIYDLASATGAALNAAMQGGPAASIASATAAANAFVPQGIINSNAAPSTGTALNAGVGPLARERIDFALASTRSSAWVAMGDSITDGFFINASAPQQAGFETQRYTAKTLGLLQARYGQAGDPVGFAQTYTLCYQYVTAPEVDNWSRSSGGAQNNSASGRFGYTTWDTVADQTQSLAYTGTSFKLHYKLGGSAFTVTVDGGAPVTISPSAGSTWTGTYSSPNLSHGTHTLVVTPTSGNIAQIGGAYVYDNDENAGIHLWNHAQGGITSGGYLAGPGTTSALQDVFTVTGRVSLVTIMLGRNDENLSTSAATLQANVQAIIANVKTVCTTLGYAYPSFVVIAYPNAGAAYLTALAAIATADPVNVAYVPLTGFPVAGDMYTDAMHPLAQGHNHIATILDAALA